MGRFDKRAPYICALDFDGTIKKGTNYDLDWKKWELTPGFLRFLRWADAQQIKLVLWTCRNLEKPEERYPVYEFFVRHGINACIDLNFKEGQKYTMNGDPFVYWGTGALKQYADFYVDDLAIGCPKLPSGTPDWGKIRELITKEMDY